LIDEPDLWLHPSGARFLRDELIKISENNYVVYSSHSIFMIDRSCINRHYIVEKEKEITQIKIANESNVVKEEVIYNALGFSFFESLKSKNILFEGWLDEKLFEKAMEKIPSQYSDLKAKFKDVGTCFGYGVNSLAQITPLLKLAGRVAWIISDNDVAAKSMKKDYIKNHGYGDWLTYEDVDPNLKVVTGEDFIKVSAIVDQLKKVQIDQGFAKGITEADFSAPKGRLDVVNKWLIDNGVTDGKLRSEILKKIKQNLFTDLKLTQIEDYYYEFLLKVGDRINQSA